MVPSSLVLSVKYWLKGFPFRLALGVLAVLRFVTVSWFTARHSTTTAILFCYVL
jgi:hypothetical protein